MAIDLTGLSSANTGSRTNKIGSTAPNNRGEAVSTAPASNAQPQPETVKLSSEAQNLSKLEERVAQLPEVDEQRVAEIKQAIAEGSFSVDPERIAAKLTSLEGQLFS